VSHELGPLAGLVGIWKGDKGTDTAPDDDPANKEIHHHRRRPRRGQRAKSDALAARAIERWTCGSWQRATAT
jgi:hypothetical protein